MSSSREESPDWLRSFQAPAHSAVTLSSDSQSSLQDSPSRKDIVDLEEPSPRKSSRISEKGKKIVSSDSQSSLQDSLSRKVRVDLEEPSPRKSSRISEKGKKQTTTIGEGGAESHSNKPSKAKDLEEPSPRKSSRISEKGKKQTTTIGESGAESPSNKPSKAKDIEEPSPRKSSRISEKGKKQTTTIGESGAESPSNKPSKAKSPKKRVKVEDQTPGQKKNTASKKRKRGDESDRIVAKEVILEKYMEPHKPNDSVLMLSSDSELDRNNKPVMEGHIHRGESSDQKTSEFQEGAKVEDVALIGSELESTSKKASKEKSLRKRLKVEDQTPVEEDKKNESIKGKGNIDNVEVTEEEASDKHSEPHVSSSRLPLVLSEKVHRTKALVECEGDSIDLSGDMGAVGRLVVSDTPSGNHEMYLDLKGTIYKTTIVPSRTFCVVSFGQSEAKIEAIMNDFIQLKPQSNVYEAETMVEGTLEGFSFDSEDEADKMTKVSSHQNDQNEDAEEQTNGKNKGKAEKTSGNARKKAKTVGGKPLAQKRVRKKSQVSKKGKTKK